MSGARSLPVVSMNTATAQSAAAALSAVQFHLSLNVRDLQRSVAFFQVFFDRPPAKLKEDYAKFEVDDPPLVLSLSPAVVQPGGTLNHLGFRLPDAAGLVDVQRRLESAGIATRREDGVECCYARQTKFWVTDPDNNLWEIYTLEADLPHCGDGGLPTVDATGPSTPEAIWRHRIGEPLPRRLPLLDDSVDRLQLEGTLNAELDAAAIAELYAELLRALRPGGTLEIRMLAADRAVADGPLQLPGPAAVVRQTPVDSDVLHDLLAAGFVGAAYTFRSAQPWFLHGEAQLRETRIAARKPSDEQF